MTHRNALHVIGVLVGLGVAPGCTTYVAVINEGYAIVAQEPSVGRVHPYPGLPGTPRPGPRVAVFLSTTADLRRLAKSHTHHLYFELLPCSQTDHRYSLYTGDVFEATEREHASVLGAGAMPDQRLYKVHLPLDYARIVDEAGGYGTIDLTAYLESARRDGTCMRLGGATMWGVSALWSNRIAAPLAIRGESLVPIGQALDLESRDGH